MSSDFRKKKLIFPGFERKTGGILLGLLFAFALRRSINSVAQTHADKKILVVIRTRNPHQFIARNGLAFFLIRLLQKALAIPLALILLYGADGRNDEAQDIFFGGGVARIQIIRANHGFHAVCQNRGLFPPSSAFFALSQDEHPVYSEFQRDRRQSLFAHDAAFCLGEVAFRIFRHVLVQERRRHQAQNAVAQKFKPLVVFVPVRRILVGIGAVMKRQVQQSQILEMQIKRLAKFQQRLFAFGRDFFWRKKITYPFHHLLQHH